MIEKLMIRTEEGCKRQTAWVYDGKQKTKIAEFVSDEAVELFKEFAREAGLIVKNYD